jgi:branched-chain amino acid transport system substrate-binding protein
MTEFFIPRRQFLLAGSAGILTLAAARPRLGLAAEDTFRIGALNPVTGAGSTYGPGMQKAILFAAEEVNAAGGAGGRKLEVFAEDTQTTPDAAVTAVKKLIEVNKVQIVMGTWSSGVTLAVMPITTEAGIPEMNTSGAPAISTEDKKDLVWRFQATNIRFGKAFAEIAEKRGYKRPATMAFNNASGIGNTEGFKNAWEAKGGKVVSEVVYEPKRPSYRSELQKVLSANPDVIVMGSYLPDTTIILREWYQSGQKCDWIIPGWAANTRLVKALGAEVTKGIISVDSVSNEKAPSYARFAEKYKAATGNDASSNLYAAMTYDMAIVWALAMQAAGPGASVSDINAKIRDVGNPKGKQVFSFEEGKAALKQGPIDYQGASSRLDFDEYGDVTPDFGESVIQPDGSFKRVAVVKI